MFSRATVFTFDWSTTKIFGPDMLHDILAFEELHRLVDGDTALDDHRIRPARR